MYLHVVCSSASSIYSSVLYVMGVNKNKKELSWMSSGNILTFSCVGSIDKFCSNKTRKATYRLKF